jgi:hypothetical protein
MSITETDYTLPEIIAISTIGTAQSGANRPLFIRGIDSKTNQRGFYVLKYQGSERMDNRTSGRELLAALLAKEWGITVPKPVKIIVSDDFLNTLIEHDDFLNIAKSKNCFNFGNVKITDNIDISRFATLTPQQLQQAARIFLFDVIIQNADRRFEKPNMFFAKGNIYIIDHELAFGFLDTLSFLRSPKPYILNETDVKSAKNHFFYPILHQNKSLNWEEVLQEFSHLPNSFWTRLREIIPTQWQTVEIEQIETHIIQIIDNFELLKIEIWTKLLAL